MNNRIYDDQNPFAQIIRGEMPAKLVYESKHSIVFPTIKPHADIHLLIIPKGKYIDFEMFMSNASNEEKTDFFETIKIVADKTGASKKDYKLINNCGKNAGQVVFHMHFHLLSGNINLKEISKL